MSIDQLGSIGEFVSSIAVVASLIYLAIQVRQNSRETRLASVQRVLEASRDTILKLSDAETQQLFERARNGLEELDEIDKRRFHQIRIAELRNIEIAFLMNAEGVLDDESFEIFQNRARMILRTYPDFRDDLHFTRRFREWLDSVRSQEPH